MPIDAHSPKPWLRSAPPRYRLVDCTLIDPKDGATYHHVTVDLKEGVIARMTKLNSGASQGPPPTSAADEALGWTHGEDVRIINLEGRFLLPGLIDCHVHLEAAPGEKDLRDSINQDHDTNLLRQTYVAREMLRRGFTSVRDCAGAGLAIKEALEEGLVVGPRLFICGHGISQTGGHGDLRSAKDAEYACCGGNTRGLGRIADGVEQCLHAAREELRKGADFIKIMVSGGVASPTDKLTSLQYSAEEIRAFTSVAEAASTYVTAHAYTPASIQNAIRNGVKGIEHGNLIDEVTAKMMAENNVFLTPTLITYSAMASEEFAGFLPPPIKEKNLQVLAAGKRSLQLADAAGVTMCFGTDLLGLMQGKQSGEFRLRKEAGLSALKILQSATVNAARMLRQEEKLGRVKEGFVADLIILNANPLEDIEVLARPERHLLAVIKGGSVVESRWSRLGSDIIDTSKIE